MHSDFTRTTREDSPTWPAYDQTEARKVLTDPTASQMVKDACTLLLGNMRVEDAIRAAVLLHEEDSTLPTHHLTMRMREILRERKVT